MHIFNNKYLLAATMLLTAATAMAVPALRKPIKATQPDGTTIYIMKSGDERRHIVWSIDERPLMRDNAGYYCFARLSADGTVEPTSIRAAALDQLSPADRATVEAIDAEAVCSKMLDAGRQSRYDTPSRTRNVVSRSGSHSGIGLMDDSFLGYKTAKGLVILVQYSDVKFDEMTQDGYFERMLNEPGFSEFNGTGSARDYFIDNSNGNFIPQFDVYGPVTLPHPMAYYGGNDSSGDDMRPAEMIYDACKALDGQINFKDYDCNGDGYVDNVFVFYAGYGEASYDDEDTIWPHQWDLESAGLTLKLDGVTIDKYACANELEQFSSNRTLPDGIGTFVHEFSHVIGLPDLYVTSGSGGSWTPDMWSVLDYGPYNNNSRTPPAYSAYERNALGWCDPIVIDGPASIDLEAINTTNQCYLIPTSKQNEFFLLENRQQTGWDKYLPGHGMLIWHIDYNASKWYTNSVNNTKSHNYVDIEEASGKYTTSTNASKRLEDLAAYPFPGTKNVTSFTDDTNPSMKTWSNVGLGLPITDITERDGIVSFNVAGGASTAEVPEIQRPSAVGEDYFVASWRKSDGAQSYRLTVTAAGTQSEPVSVTANFGSSKTATLPSGWSFVSSSGETYTTSGNYGAASPSLKLSKTGAGFTTSQFDADITAIKFWIKGQGTSSSSYVKIEGNISGVWSEIERIVPQNNVSTTVTLDKIAEAVRQLRVTYNKNLGNVALDDFTVTCSGSSTKIVDGYNDLDVGDVDSYKVDRLLPSVKEYSYKVRAVDAAGHTSAYSQSCDVVLGSAGIEDVTVDEQLAFTVAGLAVTCSATPGSTVSIVDIAGRIIAHARTDSDGVATMQVPVPGIYLLSTATAVQRIYIK